jgi:hypothetical protein
MGNSSTHSKNASASPIIAAATPVIVEVPGPTQYVDVPGPTVHINVPGPTVYIDNSLLAQFDFSQMPDQNLKVDGDYQIPVTGGSTSAQTATIKAVKCAAGIGATGIQRIKSGKLEFLPDVITSELGLQYWSNIAVPMLGIDLRTLSTKLQGDTYFQQVQYEVVVDIEPLWLNGSVSNAQTAYSYMNVGFLHNLDLWAANGTPRPQGNFTGYRHTSIPASLGRTSEIGAISFGPSGFAAASYPQGSMQTAAAPFNTFFNTSSTRMSATWNTLGGGCLNQHSNNTCSLVRSAPAGNMNATTTYSLPSTFTAGRTTNNLWMVAYCSRSTGSIQANDVPFRIKKISIFERSL